VGLASREFQQIEEALPLLFGDATGLPPGRGRNGNAPQRIPDGLAPWIEHLLALDEMADLLPAAGVTLTYEELRGLALLRRAKRQFADEHARCLECRTVYRLPGRCPRGCGQ